MSQSKIMALLVAGSLAGGFIYMLSQGKFHSADGKLFGIVEEDETSFGADDILKGMAVVGVAVFGAKLIHGAGVPVPTLS
jgi:hypothetical protein